MLITTCEYNCYENISQKGYITAVTDQNRNRYLENEYDYKGRVIKQSFPDGIYQTFTYDDVHKRNTVYYSEYEKTEIYEKYTL